MIWFIRRITRLSMFVVLATSFYISAVYAQPSNMEGNMSEPTPRATQESKSGMGQSQMMQENQSGMGQGQMMQGNQSRMGQGQTGMENMPMGEQCNTMCRGMMEMEMAAYPWKVAGGAIFGILVIAALALLVVLEVVWVRLWAARLKKEKG